MAEKKIEEIGKVKLDLTFWPGEDLYCDGEVEDRLLEIARDYAEVEYQGIIEESANWPILYHLSPLRENIVDWLPITRDMKVLEVGAGCGAITGALSRKAGSVTCVDLSRKRSRINAYRHMNLDNITIRVGNFMDVEGSLDRDYDFICLIGVFEYGYLYTGGKTPYEDLLNLIKSHLKPNGNIVIAIESKFGLKYWAGCKEDHLGTWFSGLEDYPESGPVRTFTNKGLIEIAKKCGYTDSEIHMYYPYPDYKFMNDLYSDRRLPHVGELKLNERNFDRDRIQLFNEKRVFDTVIREGVFPLFSNSYMMVLGPAFEITYVRYSDDRDISCRIKTEMKESGTQKWIEKHALSKEGEAHVDSIFDSYQLLGRRYEGGNLKINRAVKGEEPGTVKLDYIEGVTLEQLLDEKLAENDMDGFLQLFDRYLEWIDYGNQVPVTDYDLIFSNILVDEDGNWTVIDYEWTVTERRDTKEIAFRAIYCYLLEDEKRNKINLDLIMERLSVTATEAEAYRRDEMTFQKKVTGKHLSLAEMREKIGNPVYTMDILTQNAGQDAWRDRVQIYENTGKGFSEEESYFVDGGELYLQVRHGRSALRIDPCSDFCLVRLEELKWNGVDIPRRGKGFSYNGTQLQENLYVFDTQDPGFTIDLMSLTQENQNDLLLKMEVTRISEDTAKAFGNKKRFGLF